MKFYLRTKGTRNLYIKARDQVSLYMQVRVDELMAEFDLTFDQAVETTVKEMTNMAESISDEIY